MPKGTIYLIPSLLAPDSHAQAIPPYNQEIIKNLSLFFVENLRSARRFISGMGLGLVISELEFYELSKKTEDQEVNAYLHLLLEGRDAGIISEAGCPGIADPGARLCDRAHREGITVKPLVGPSSILLALMASGMSGQSFAFHGYLPIPKDERKKRIKFLEKLSAEQNQTQIFMETPYRNNQLFQSLLQHCAPRTRLCVALNLQAPEEWIHTWTIREWREKALDLHKQPAIFLLERG